MQFSNTTTNAGLVQDCEDKTGLGDTGISGDTAKLKTFTRYINLENSELVGRLLQIDGRWQYDDTNHTGSPTATGDLTSGTGKYDIFLASPSSSQDWLVVERVEIKDSDGNWTKLRSMDKADTNIAMEEYKDSDSIPTKYDWTGSQIRLFPAPNYSSTGGIKFYMKRAPLAFATSDTTKSPGFPSTHHEILSLGASFRYCYAHDMSRASGYNELKEAKTQDLIGLFSQRNKDEKTKITRKKRNYK